MAPRDPARGLPPQVDAFIQAVAPFELVQAEVIMLLNAAPRSLVELHLIVEECEERLDAAQRQQLLQLCVGLTRGDAVSDTPLGSAV